MVSNKSLEVVKGNEQTFLVGLYFDEQFMPFHWRCLQPFPLAVTREARDVTRTYEPESDTQ